MQPVEESLWHIPGRGARLLVDLDRIESNVAIIAANISQSTSVLAVVKASGYGHGGPPAAEAALAGGASWLGVATVAEGIELRANGIRSPVLVLGPTMPAEALAAVEHDLQLTIGAVEQVAAIENALRVQGHASRVNVHLKINTGMNRFGVNPDQAIATAIAITSSTVMSATGVCTHFAKADEGATTATLRQAEVFRHCLKALEDEGLKPPLVHASNSAALIRFRDLDFDMVRPGICIYGVRPAADVSLFPGMRPALKVMAAVQRLATLRMGDEVGYGGAFVAERAVPIALLPVGYGDGIPRSLSEQGWAGYRGNQLPIAGRISMDQTVVHAAEAVGLRVGDPVTLVGDGSDGEPTVEEFAAIAGTIPYEILTGLGLRLPAYYVRRGGVVAGDNARLGAGYGLAG